MLEDGCGLLEDAGLDWSRSDRWRLLCTECPPLRPANSAEQLPTLCLSCSIVIRTRISGETFWKVNYIGKLGFSVHGLKLFFQLWLEE